LFALAALAVRTLTVRTLTIPTLTVAALTITVAAPAAATAVARLALLPIAALAVAATLTVTVLAALAAVTVALRWRFGGGASRGRLGARVDALGFERDLPLGPGLLAGPLTVHRMFSLDLDRHRSLGAAAAAGGLRSLGSGLSLRARPGCAGLLEDAVDDLGLLGSRPRLHAERLRDAQEGVSIFAFEHRAFQSLG
ncbi:MAG TPA: hypothetical protein VK461_13640, partial [Acidimicrobiales bacterium]|nr:hypothetical protein [Acidimicrobiales bacterium]